MNYPFITLRQFVSYYTLWTEDYLDIYEWIFKCLIFLTSIFIMYSFMVLVSENVVSKIS